MLWTELLVIRLEAEVLITFVCFSTLAYDNYGMIIYVTDINFFLPTFILAPLFVRWSHLTKQASPKPGVNPTNGLRSC